MRKVILSLILFTFTSSISSTAISCTAATEPECSTVRNDAGEETALIPVPDPEQLMRTADINTGYCSAIDHSGDSHEPVSPYRLPYSLTMNNPDWHRLWLNTAVYAGAFVGTLSVLECLPEDATSWNRAEIRNTPMFKRWYNNVFKLGPKWDTDSWIFNYIMHPYAGAVYFMSARSSGFNFWRSLLYSATVSTIGWEFGIEAFMERPSIQDLFITPCVGSIIGECFYRVKRRLVENDYYIAGSRTLGNIVAFFIDPVNEVLGLMIGNPARLEAERRRGLRSSLTPAAVGGAPGFTFTCTF